MTRGTFNAQDRAKQLVADNYNAHRNVERNEEIKVEDLRVVWFSKTLENWKALIATNRKDGLYYEVTHNGATKETYVDIYNKIANTSVPDSKS